MGLTCTNSVDSLADGMCRCLNVVSTGELYANPREAYTDRLSGYLYTLPFSQTMILVWAYPSVWSRSQMPHPHFGDAAVIRAIQD